MKRTQTESVFEPLALDGATFYAETEGGTGLRLGVESGAVAWRRRLPGAVRAAPVATPLGLAVAMAADTLYLLDKTSGEVRARLATPGTVLAAPALAESRLYFGTTGGHVLAVELPGLAVAWDHPAGDGVFGAVAVARDTVYALARDGALWLIPVAHPAGARAIAVRIVATAGPTPPSAGVLGG